MLRPDALTEARILVVDDQLANVALLQDLLEQAGYAEVRGITKPRQAEVVFAEFRPDLVLLDLIMPGLDGFGVIARLRPLIAEGEYLPILMLTADIKPEVKRRALAEGATDFLNKPLDTVEVLLRIRNLLQTRALHLSLRGQNTVLESTVQARTRELEEARAEVLGLYRELAKRNQELHDLVGRLVQTGDEERRRADAAAHDRAGAETVERLTPREHEVLRLVAQGQTNNEHIIAKLGVADRTQAAVRAVDLGLLSARKLTTVLFTDVVGSTELAVSIGDGRWHDLKQRFYAVMRSEVSRFQGEEINTAGDGVLVTFEAPERAVRCACAVRESLRGLGITVRSGLHTGEVERQGRELSGVAVHIGARVREHAQPGDVLVSSVVRDLLSGTSLTFADCGPTRLKGVPGEWRLYSVTA